jgi:hypothetical protein
MKGAIVSSHSIGADFSPCMPSNREPSTINPPYYNNGNYDLFFKKVEHRSTPEISQERNDQGHVSMVEDMKVLVK